MATCKEFSRLMFLCAVVCVALLLCLCLPSSLVSDAGGSKWSSMVELDGFVGTNLTVWPANYSSGPSRALNVLGNQKGTSWGYLLAVDYEQQLMGGFMGFYHLANITSMLNLSSVEPYVRKTGLEGAPIIDGGSDAQVLKLSSFYDLDKLRGLVKSCCGGNHLVSFETFMESASRDVVLVAFLYSLKDNRQHFKSGSKVVEIGSGTVNLLSSLNTLNRWANFVARWQGWESALFRVSRVVLVDARPLHPLPLSDLVERLGSIVREQVAKFGSATVILDSWRDIQIKFISKFFYSMPGFQWRDCDAMDTARHSETVIAATQKFRQSLNETHPVVAVHIRVERLLTDFRGSVAHYLECLRQLKSVLTNGTVANATRATVQVFHDLGKYGTRACTYLQHCFCGRSHFLSLIERLGYQVVFFDPEWFRPADLRGAFAAFVEMEYLSNVDVLVTVGRGEYQDHVVERFVENHRGRQRANLHRICHNPQPIPRCYPHC